MAIFFHYSPTLTAHLDWVRFLVGDVREATAELDDQEITALLDDTEEPDEASATANDWRGYRYQVAAKAAEAIAAKHAPDSDVSFDNQRVALSAKFAQYRALAVKLRSLAFATAGGTVRTERW